MTIAAYGGRTERAVPCCPHCGVSLNKLPDHGVLIYADSGFVVREGKRVRLTPYQMIILECLMDEYPRNVSRNQINDALYGHYDMRASNTINVLLVYMRPKLAKLGLSIVNTPGFGWRMETSGSAQKQNEV